MADTTSIALENTEGYVYLLLELHADCIGLLEEDGVSPEQVAERGELVEAPLPEGPQSELSLARSPRHYKGKTVHSARKVYQIN